MVAGFAMILVAWIVNFRLKGERIFNVVVYPAMSLGITTGFIGILLRTTDKTLDIATTVFLSALALGFLTYILTASINILNLSAIKNIPLGQAGRAAHYVLTMIFSYLTFVLLVSYELNIFVKVLIVVLFVFAYTFVALWTIGLQYSQRLVSALGIAVLMGFVFFILSIWPLQAFYFALFMTFVFYMCLGLALEIRDIVSRWIWYEYVAIFIVMIILLLATAPWGINGTIL